MMKNNKGITLIMVIMTVILLAILAGLALKNGMDTFESSKVVKFESYMKVIQKEVDIILEEGTDYMNLGQALTSEHKQKLQAILSNEFVETNSVEEPKLRYFSSSDIENVFNIKDVEDEIVVNFANREVISLNGVEKNGVMHYVEYGLH